jgi:hypothetical protein
VKSILQFLSGRLDSCGDHFSSLSSTRLFCRHLESMEAYEEGGFIRPRELGFAEKSTRSRAKSLNLEGRSKRVRLWPCIPRPKVLARQSARRHATLVRDNGCDRAE